MSKEKSAAELFEEFNKNYDSKETKKFVAQVKADSQKLDKMFVTTPSDQKSKNMKTGRKKTVLQR
ncbi:MAG: hypothetical protein AB8U43_07620 [Rickettsia aeschlimannii]